MIIVKLIGGLGNQLFQYAVGRALAEINKVPLFLDISEFEIYKLHKFSLQHFALAGNIAGPKELDPFFKDRSLVRKVADKLLPYYKRSIIQERGFHFDPNILRVGKNAYLDGFWQSEKYFKNISALLHKELAIKTPPSPANQKLLSLLKTGSAVSLHIRRADYVTDTKTNKVHGACSLDYYARATEHITQQVKDPHFFLFSDDIAWVKQNLKLDHPHTYVDINDADTNYEDLRLMSQCQHNIIANSSFSWWSAWLNKNPGKIVIAPQKWFNDNTRNSKDLLPESWLKL